MGDSRARAIEQLRHREPGTDEDPYEDVDISTLPDWWRLGIVEHREYGLRPYRPPRFANDEVTVPVVEELESMFDVTIQFRGLGVELGEPWTAFVTVNRRSTSITTGTPTDTRFTKLTAVDSRA